MLHNQKSLNKLKDLMIMQYFYAKMIEKAIIQMEKKVAKDFFLDLIGFSLNINQL